MSSSTAHPLSPVLTQGFAEQHNTKNLAKLTPGSPPCSVTAHPTPSTQPQLPPEQKSSIFLEQSLPAFYFQGVSW